jgi:hypothetical protein
LIIIALGIWVLVIQNAIIHKNQIVYVSGGSIDASIENTVDVKGSVDIDNTVDVNLEEILGYKVGCHDSYVGNNGQQHVGLDVFNE